eukprot:COSAG02_NODE_2610_length_8431_cov_94.540206_2_plen_76_part_00
MVAGACWASYPGYNTYASQRGARRRRAARVRPARAGGGVAVAMKAIDRVEINSQGTFTNVCTGTLGVREEKPAPG